MGNFGDDLVAGLKRQQRQRELEPVAEGYQAAADICLEELTRPLDRIEAKVEAGDRLSSEEEVLRTELHVIRSKMERRLRDFWVRNYSM